MSPELRAVVRSSVAFRLPVDERERVSIERFLFEFDRLADPFDQSLDPVHVTGSAIVVGRRGVVLLKHKRLGIWIQPGGHLDPGESPWDAALRETIEETGLPAAFADAPAGTSPELIHVDVHDGGRGHTHLDLRYLVAGGDADPQPPVDESQDVVWCTWDDALAKSEGDGLTGLFRSIRPR